MIISVYNNRKKARIRFFAAYAFSVLLILVLFSSFLKPAAGIVEKIEPLVKKEEDHHSIIYQYLHQRMERLDNVCVHVAGNRSAANLSLLEEEERGFYASIDSIRKSFSTPQDAKKEKELVALLEAFSGAAAKQIGLARGNAPSVATATGDSGALQEQLQAKEQRIAELESQNQALLQENEKVKADLQNKPASPATVIQQPANSGVAEWRTKYEAIKADNEKLKESNDRYASQINSLRKSYKDVVEDNRRLLTQLQSARAGRN